MTKDYHETSLVSMLWKPALVGISFEQESAFLNLKAASVDKTFGVGKNGRPSRRTKRRRATFRRRTVRAHPAAGVLQLGRRHPGGLLGRVQALEVHHSEWELQKLSYNHTSTWCQSPGWYHHVPSLTFICIWSIGATTNPQLFIARHLKESILIEMA